MDGIPLGESAMKLDSRKMILVLLPTVMAPITLAQEGLAVRNLSVKPRLQENGRYYNVEVRFTTNTAALARMHYGTDQRCEEVANSEMEPRRNHRFDVANVPIGQKRWIRLAASAEGQSEIVG